jgi:hypothetical protein
MYYHLIILLLLVSLQLNILSAQPWIGNGEDSMLLNFIENKTSFTDSDPVPALTDFGENQQAFPWLYLDLNKWKNLTGYLEDPYFRDIHARNLLALKEMARKGNCGMVYNW